MEFHNYFYNQLYFTKNLDDWLQKNNIPLTPWFIEYPLYKYWYTPLEYVTKYGGWLLTPKYPVFAMKIQKVTKKWLRRRAQLEIYNWINWDVSFIISSYVYQADPSLFIL